MREPSCSSMSRDATLAPAAPEDRTSPAPIPLAPPVCTVTIGVHTARAPPESSAEKITRLNDSSAFTIGYRLHLARRAPHEVEREPDIMFGNLFRTQWPIGTPPGGQCGAHCDDSA